MLLLHTSDWHLGMQRTQTATYQKDHEYFLARLCELIDARHVDAVLLSGDVYDTGVSRAEAVRQFSGAVEAICADRSLPMIVIAGNHDSGDRLAFAGELLRRQGLHIRGRLSDGLDPVLLDGGRVAIWPIPYFMREEVRREDGTPCATTEEAFARLTGDMAARLDPAACNVCMAHTYVTGAPLGESDRAARVGHSDAVSHEVFSAFDYTALGHIHRPYAPAEGVRYCGSPLKFAFDEEGQTKGVVLYDTEAKKAEFVPLPLLHDRRSVTASWEELNSPGLRERLQGAYLNLTVTDRAASRALTEDLRALYPDLMVCNGQTAEESAGDGLTREELRTLSDEGLMKRFLAERCGLTPTDRQTRLFLQALATVRNGGEDA